MKISLYILDKAYRMGQLTVEEYTRLSNERKSVNIFDTIDVGDEDRTFVVPIMKVKNGK